MDPNENLFYCTLIARLGVFCLGGSVIYHTYRYWINGYRYVKDAESSDKVAIVTGASRGIGKEVALGLAKRGLTVVIACRDMENGLRAQNEIIERTGNSNVKCMHLDLASFKSVRQFADEFLTTYPRLDILINNASVMHLKRQVTKDNIESNIGINYFGHFLLTMLLIKRMSSTSPARIINISNWLHRCAEIDQTDLMYERQFCGFLAYCRSQLANAYFTTALSNRIRNTGITCNCVHTGISLADFIEHQDEFSKWIPKRWLILLAKLLCKTQEACADTILFAAIDFSCQNVSGVYLSNTQYGQMGANANNDSVMEWLWNTSEEITGETLCELPNNFKFLKEVKFESLTY